jgi:dipeptidyl aminopeptidase/acylaminoacyl peptidase
MLQRARLPRVVSPSFSLLGLVGLLGLASACAPNVPAASPEGATGGPTGVAAGASASAAGPTAGKHPFGVDDMLAMDRIEDPDVSPDGKWVVFTVSTPDVAANKSRRDVWIAATDGSGARRLTSHPATDHGARFAPDGKTVYFVSTRSESAQVWKIAIDGGEAQKVTDLPVDVDGVLPFPDGKRLLLAMEVYPDAPSLDESAKRAAAKDKDPSHVHAFDALPFRHWDAWDEGKRNHLFVWSEGGTTVDLLKDLPFDAPPKPFGGLEEVSISKDGKEVVFTSKMVGREDAWSTNGDLWLVPADGSAKPRALTTDNPADDGNPVFSPDGTRLAYLAQARPQYESDRRRVVVMDWKTKTSKVLADAWDRNPGDLSWSKDGKSLFASADHLGRRAVFKLDAATGAATPIVDGGSSHGPVATAGGKVVYLHDALRAPTEIWTAGQDGRGPKAITHLNDARVAAVSWGEPEQFTFKGAHGDTVYGWMVKPAVLPPNAKVPVAFLIHGGPQGSFGDHFHYRWNPEIYAAHGYATVMIDFHGSTGYGQAFTDAIRGDWGGAPYEDLMKGLDAALARYTFMDKGRMAALGASYGGYMINWIQGSTDRFKALVCHDGNLDEVMAYYETEELWFPEWEHGKTPWENPDGYQKHNPLNLVKNWKTPELVIHGGKDFRVVDVQGMATFTALQRKGIPSRFVHFPDENHWVVKPANSKRWHQEVLSWIDKYTGEK